ncbi:MAG: hypothetical protein LBR12_01170 [Opitutaceae bacterium]|nr:hypothetical protein [Opitutaceae bacterium]
MEKLLRSKVYHQDESALERNAAPKIENLLLDAGFVACDTVAGFYGYVPHIRPRGEERREKSKTRASAPNAGLWKVSSLG